MRRILSIDGGGIKGVFAASFLAEIEDGIDGRIGDYFDLIAGTSTGGIIAIGLAMGISARDLTSLYEREGPQIFGGRRWLRHARWLLRAKYDSNGLRQALAAELGDRQLWEARTRLLIPAQLSDTGDIYIYKTPHHEDLQTDWRDRAVDVALATSAAPTYFPAAQAVRGPELLDGGLWANNPVALACVEAVGHRLRWPLDTVRVLSISCTSSPIRQSRARRCGITGLLGWARAAPEIMMEGQSKGAMGMVTNLLGRDRVRRIDAPVPQGLFRIDDVRAIKALIGLGKVQARHDGKGTVEGFLSAPAERFEPCYRP